jgi:hypothetical protein
VVGNPGTTQRQLTTSQLRFFRDVSLLPEQLMRSELRGKLARIEQESPEGARLVADTLVGLENSYKVFYGRQRALADETFFGRKIQEENDLKARVAADPALRAEIGDPWGEVERAYDAYEQLYPAYYFLESNAGGGSSLMGWARTLVRGAMEREKPSAERLPEFADASLPAIERNLGAARKVEPELERLYLGHWLSKTREYLTADDASTRLLLGRDSPATRANALVSGTKLADPAVRKALWSGGLAAVRASDDPLIKYVLAMDPAARAVRAQVEQQVTGPTNAARTRLARARFAAYGQNVYPDATFSPRITFGRVEGWTERGRQITPFTNIAGCSSAPPDRRPTSCRRAGRRPPAAEPRHGVQLLRAPPTSSAAPPARHAQRARRGDRRGVRRQHPLARRRLRLRPAAQPLGPRGLVGDPGGAAQGLQPAARGGGAERPARRAEPPRAAPPALGLSGR